MLPDYSAFWSTVAQVCVALGLGIAVEATRIRKTWPQSNRLARALGSLSVSCAGLVVVYLAASALSRLGYSQAALAAAVDKLGFDPLASVTVAIVGVFAIAAILIVNPSVSILLSEKGVGFLGRSRILRTFFEQRQILRVSTRELSLANTRAARIALALAQLEDEFREHGKLSRASLERESYLSAQLAGELKELRRLARVRQDAADTFAMHFWRPKAIQIDELDAALSAVVEQRLRPDSDTGSDAVQKDTV